MFGGKLHDNSMSSALLTKVTEYGSEEYRNKRPQISDPRKNYFETKIDDNKNLFVE